MELHCVKRAHERTNKKALERSISFPKWTLSIKMGVKIVVNFLHLPILIHFWWHSFRWSIKKPQCKWKTAIFNFRYENSDHKFDFGIKFSTIFHHDDEVNGSGPFLFELEFSNELY